MSPLSYPCRLRRLLAAFAVVAVSLLGLGAAPATAAAVVATVTPDRASAVINSVDGITVTFTNVEPRMTQILVVLQPLTADECTRQGWAPISNPGVRLASIGHNDATSTCEATFDVDPVSPGSTVRFHWDTVMPGTAGTLSIRAESYTYRSNTATITVTDALRARLSGPRYVLQPGETFPVTATIINGSSAAGTLDRIRVNLPDGFTYVAGSTSGITTDEPTSTAWNTTGTGLIWDGPFAIPGDGQVSLSLSVRATTIAPSVSTLQVLATGASWPQARGDYSAFVDNQAVTLRATADHKLVVPGAQTGWTIVADNDTRFGAPVSRVSVTLPDGFTYVAGSTSGATSADPSISGQVATWTGPFTVPGESTAEPLFHFETTAGSPGTYSVSVSGTDPRTAVTGSTGIAPVQVVADAGISAGGPYGVYEGTAMPIAGSPLAVGDEFTRWSWRVAPDGPIDAGTTCSIAAPAEQATTVSCTDDGNFLLTLTATRANGQTATATARLFVENAKTKVALVSPANESSFPVGTPISVRVAVTDLGSNDPLTATAKWCDGFVQSGPVVDGTFTSTHAVGTARTCSVVIVGKDGDGGSGSTSLTLNVTAAASTSISGSGSVVYSGKTTTFTVSATKSGTKLTGSMSVRTPGGVTVASSTVTSFTRSGSTVTWGGPATWAGKTGYRYSIIGTDNAGTTMKDKITIKVFNSAGVRVFYTTGPLASGDLKLTAS